LPAQSPVAIRSIEGIDRTLVSAPADHYACDFRRECRVLNLCRADKVLLTGGATLLGSAALFGATPLAVGIPAGALAAVLADGIFRPSSATLYPTISHGPRHRPQVALTFDDGPDAEVTPAVLDVLSRFGARGTFFVIGRKLQDHVAVAERVVADGHELGNHSWTHSYFQNFYSAERHATEIESNARLIKQLTRSQSDPLYRSPVGLKSPPLARAAYALNLRIVAWSVHTRDTISRDATALATRVLARIRPGDIVLMHDGHERAGRQRRVALEALPRILQGLQERELQAVSVTELLRP
jgi:peptidoglycan/xylan/chitin deacetylase (PgdA/CDA1 family)